MTIAPSRKIFVAGGTGMVGSAIIRKLLSSGYTDIVSTFHRRPPSEAFQTRVRWTRLDLRRQAETEEFFERERPAYVFLAAAKVGGILANDTYRADFIYDNIAVACNVIGAAHRYDTEKLLNLGSSCVYPRLAPQPLREAYLLTGPLEPTNEAYAIAKIAAIKLCRYFNEQYGTNYLSLMPTNLYGPEDNFNLETSHLLPAFVRKFHLGKLLAAGDHAAVARDIAGRPLGFGLDSRITPGDPDAVSDLLAGLGITGEAITLWGTGRPYREFLHVDDVASGALLLLERCDASSVGELVNIGAGEDRTIDEVARLVKEIVGFRGEIAYDATKPDGMPRKVLDVSQMAQLGWRPSIALDEGIRRTYEWYAGEPGRRETGTT